MIDLLTILLSVTSFFVGVWLARRQSGKFVLGCPYGCDLKFQSNREEKVQKAMRKHVDEIHFGVWRNE